MITYIERFRQCPSCDFTFISLESLKTPNFWTEYAIKNNIKFKESS